MDRITKIAWIVLASGMIALPAASATSTSHTSVGATGTFSQTVDFPTDTLFAALALRNSGFGFGGFGAFDSIANIQRSGSFNVFNDHTFSLGTDDALNLAALGGCRFGGCFDTFGSGFFGGSFGTGFGTSSLTRCVQERVFGSGIFSGFC